ncbi:MAG: hypothetical protein ACXW4Q_09730 [Anaerolineales bacterium]
MRTLGEQLRLLDELEVEQRQLLVKNARHEHARFWGKWHPFRCTEQGDGEGNAFWHVVDLIDRDMDADGTRGLFADFLNLPPGTLVVDIASGARPTMLEVLLKRNNTLSGYVAIEPDINSESLKNSFQLKGHGHLLEHIPYDFWEGFPAQQVSEIARKGNATKVVTMTYWGATYLPKKEIRDWVTEALTVSDAIYINMPTQGKFQPQVLKQRYLPLLIKLVLGGKVSISDALRALRAIKKMVLFGNEFSELMPLWTVDEIQEILADVCKINRVKQDIMWKQTAFLELHPVPVQ